jgi:hypothetical protein
MTFRNNFKYLEINKKYIVYKPDVCIKLSGADAADSAGTFSNG